MNVPVDSAGGLQFADGVSAPGKYLELRAERDILVVDQQLPPAQQPLQRLQPHRGAAAGMVGMTALAEPRTEVSTGGIEVVVAGTQTTVQDLGGRRGLWGVGVPPSGAWDDLSFALANLAVGNASDAAGLEAVLRGPKLRFVMRTVVAVTGAVAAANIDGVPLAPGVATVVEAGQLLDLGAAAAPGLRRYLAVQGGLDVPVALGSRATFLLGKFGGFEGRALKTGDVLPRGRVRWALRRHGCSAAAAGAVGASGRSG